VKDDLKAKLRKQEVRLEVKIPTATMLKVLWTANMSKGSMRIETPNEVPPSARVSVALVLPGQEITLPALWKACTPRKGGKGFFVDVQFGDISDDAREKIERVIGTVRDFKRPEAAKSSGDLFDDSDIDIE